MMVSSAPAKMILAGEHAVVYGYPALVAALDLRTSCTWEESNDDLWRILDRDGSELTWTTPELMESEAYLARCLATGVRAFPGLTPQHVVISSDVPLGSGFGSSASTAAAILGGLMALATQSVEIDRNRLFALVMEIETVMHGKPSGVDPTAVIYGGLIHFQKDANGVPHFQRLAPKQHPPLHIFYSGKPQESTREMIELVAANRTANADATAANFRSIEQEVMHMEQMFLSDAAWNEADFASSVQTLHRALVSLGVVSQKVASLIASWEQLGAAAKICGAGGKKDGCGLVLVAKAENVQRDDIRTTHISEQGVLISYQD